MGTNTMRTFVAALGLQSVCGFTCQYNKPGYGVLTYQAFQTDNDCRTGKRMMCLGGNMMQIGEAMGCPQGCTFKGQEFKHFDTTYDCESGFIKTCRDGSMQIVGPVSVPEDCPYKDCSYQGEIVSH